VTEPGSAARVESDRYRERAARIRALIPSLKDPQAIADLRVLAERYERLAEHLDATAGTPPEGVARRG
jgi:hypothetical protein